MAEVADEAIKLLKIMVSRNNNAISAFRYRIIDLSISGNPTLRFYKSNVGLFYDYHESIPIAEAFSIEAV